MFDRVSTGKGRIQKMLAEIGLERTFDFVINDFLSAVVMRAKTSSCLHVVLAIIRSTYINTLGQNFGSDASGNGFSLIIQVRSDKQGAHIHECKIYDFGSCA